VCSLESRTSLLPSRSTAGDGHFFSAMNRRRKVSEIKRDGHFRVPELLLIEYWRGEQVITGIDFTQLNRNLTVRSKVRVSDQPPDWRFRMRLSKKSLWLKDFF
jgi:hypothetical protein